MSRQELNRLISQDLLFYNQTRPLLSNLFLDFIEEYCSVFTQTFDFQYILVPCGCHNEFQKYLENPDEKTIYNDHEHHHYIDPQMKPLFYRFCQIHQVIPMCQNILACPSHRRLPVSLIIDEIKGNIAPRRYFPLLIQSVEPSGLSFLLPMTKHHDSISIAHLLLRYSQRFPLYIGKSFITNWLVLQGCPMEMLDAMWNNGFPMNFPLQIEEDNQRLCSIDQKIVEWCFNKCCDTYPFDTSIDLIIMNNSYSDERHFPLVHHSIRNGHIPSLTAFSILLKKTNLSGKDLYFKDFATQKLKTDYFDVAAWAETAWQANQDETIEIILTFCKKPVLTHLVIHLCMNMMDIIHADMDYWVLRLWGSFSRYMNFSHLVRFYKDGKIVNVDKRILEYMKKPVYQNSTQKVHPPFYEKHPQTIVFRDKLGNNVELPVYFSFLRSGLLSRIATPPTGFMPSSHPDKNTIKLDLGLPNIFNDQKKVMSDWIMYSYIREISYYSSIEDVIDLYHLSQYLLDEDCEKNSEKWLDQQYMIHYDTHMKHHDKKQECLLCSFWNR